MEPQMANINSRFTLLLCIKWQNLINHVFVRRKSFKSLHLSYVTEGAEAFVFSFQRLICYPFFIITYMWMVIRTKPRAEKKVEQLLNHLTLDKAGKPLVADALTVKVKRKWSDRTKIVEVPAVSGYVFARFDMDLPLSDKINIISKIRFTPGVLRFLTLPGRSQFRIEDLAMISDRELSICYAAALSSGNSIVANEAAPETSAETKHFTPGTQVRFREGPLADLNATFLVENTDEDTPTLFINEGIFKNARFTVSNELLEVVK